MRDIKLKIDKSFAVKRVYHVGFDIIKEIDLKHGRSNADFGQGFYLSPDLDFSKKWARRA